jgi:hypothetical protein
LADFCRRVDDLGLDRFQRRHCLVGVFDTQGGLHPRSNLACVLHPLGEYVGLLVTCYRRAQLGHLDDGVVSETWPHFRLRDPRPESLKQCRGAPRGELAGARRGVWQNPERFVIEGQLVQPTLGADHDCAPDRAAVPHAQLVCHIGVGEGEIGDHVLGHEQALEHCTVYEAAPQLEIRAYALELLVSHGLCDDLVDVVEVDDRLLFAGW